MSGRAGTGFHHAPSLAPACVACRAAARLDNVPEVETGSERLGDGSLDLRQRITRDHQLLVGLDLRLARLGTGLRPARLPREIVDRLRTP